MNRPIAVGKHAFAVYIDGKVLIAEKSSGRVVGTIETGIRMITTSYCCGNFAILSPFERVLHIANEAGHVRQLQRVGPSLDTPEFVTMLKESVLLCGRTECVAVDFSGKKLYGFSVASSVIADRPIPYEDRFLVPLMSRVISVRPRFGKPITVIEDVSVEQIARCRDHLAVVGASTYVYKLKSPTEAEQVVKIEKSGDLVAFRRGSDCKLFAVADLSNVYVYSVSGERVLKLSLSNTPHAIEWLDGSTLLVRLSTRSGAGKLRFVDLSFLP